MDANWIELIVQNTALILALIIPLLFSKIKVIQWSSKKISRTLILGFILLILGVLSMSIVRSFNINGISYYLLDGFSTGLPAGFISSACYRRGKNKLQY